MSAGEQRRPEAIAARLVADGIADRAPAVGALRFAVWAADEHLTGQGQPLQAAVDASAAPLTAYWRGYRSCALEVMRQQLQHTLTSQDVPWELRHAVITAVITRLIAHT